MTKERNLNNVILNIINIIPISEKDFISELQYQLESIDFINSELVNEDWIKIMYILVKNLPTVPSEEWHFKVWSIFNNEPVGKIKFDYKLLNENYSKKIK
jgi:hypothetical protein